MELVVVFFSVVGAALLFFGFRKHSEMEREHPEIRSYLDDPQAFMIISGSIDPDILRGLTRADLYIFGSFLCLGTAIFFGFLWVIAAALRAM